MSASGLFRSQREGAQLLPRYSRIKHERLREHERLRRFALRLRLSRSQREAVLNSDPSGLGGSIVLRDGRTMLRNKYATLSYQHMRRRRSARETSGDFHPIATPSGLATFTLIGGKPREVRLPGLLCDRLFACCHRSVSPSLLGANHARTASGAALGLPHWHMSQRGLSRVTSEAVGSKVRGNIVIPPHPAFNPATEERKASHGT